MAKGAYIGVDDIACKIKKSYIGIDGVARKIKKAYIGIDGIAKLCWSGSVDVATMAISYTGNMQDAGVVTMSGTQYRLLTLTSSGTLTVSDDVNAEVWMCGGGSYGISYYSGEVTPGGAGAFTNQATVTISGQMAAIVGAAQGDSSFGGVTAKGVVSSKNGGTGGGGSGKVATKADNSVYKNVYSPGTGDGISKYPFEDSSYFQYPHCAGGGGGTATVAIAYGMLKGGTGGSNGENGGSAYDWSGSQSGMRGDRGHYGGGLGGFWVGNNKYIGLAATYYGAGGGGGVDANGNCAAGYQGIIYIRIPIEQ